MLRRSSRQNLNLSKMFHLFFSLLRYTSMSVTENFYCTHLTKKLIIAEAPVRTGNTRDSTCTPNVGHNGPVVLANCRKPRTTWEAGVPSEPVDEEDRAPPVLLELSALRRRMLVGDFRRPRTAAPPGSRWEK